MSTPDIRKNGQVVQPNVEQTPDNNGWPEPLTDPSTPYKIAVTDGKNGEQSNMDGLKTSQDIWSLTEGNAGSGNSEADGVSGQRASGDKVSQKIWSDPAGKAPSAPAKQWQDPDESVRSSDPLKTGQQSDGEHHDPAGE